MLSAGTLDDIPLANHLVEDALENCVSSFDGFAREVARRQSAKATDPARASRLSFQNLDRARTALQNLFAIDLQAGLSPVEWRSLHIAFMKRHVIAHKAGVIDEQYIKETGEPSTLLGRRVQVKASDVEQAAASVLALGVYLLRAL